MGALSRRKFIGAVAGGTAACLGPACKNGPVPGGAATESRPALIHATDLYRPHIDPDDHFDLATVFALAAQGRFDLLAVMIDHPPAGAAVDPDVLAVAQLARITGLAVPVLTGSPRRLEPAEASLPENGEATAGVRTLLKLLGESRRPVLISVVGSCRDVALAGRLAPDLFKAKCAGVYLNAGSGTPDRALAARLEYNVNLDPVSYAAMFDLPCPLYWLPCFEVAPGGGVPFASGEFGTFYRFAQTDLFSRLSPRLQNYFAFMLKQGESDRAHHSEADALSPSWLRALEAPPDEALLERQGALARNMWSTAGFFHAAGLSVTGSGGLVGHDDSAAEPVYTFDPIRVRCGADGVTEWSPDPGSRGRFIIHVRDQERYPAAMTAALGEILSSLSRRTTMTATAQKIIPNLWYDRQAEEAARFYASLFEGSKIGPVTRASKAGFETHGLAEGTVLTVEFELAGQRFVALNGGPLFKFNPSVSFLVACRTKDEVDAVWSKLAAGGTALMELGRYPFSEWYGWTTDKYGLSWQVMDVGERPIKQKIIPSLMYVGPQCGRAEEAIRLYGSIFKNSAVGEVLRYGAGEDPDREGTIKHAEFTLEGQEFAAMDSAYGHEFAFNEAVSLMVPCATQAEIDFYWGELIADGGAESMCGWLKDKFGVSWQITPERLEEMLRDPDPGKVERVTNAFLKMKKSDLAELERVYRGKA